MFNLKMGEDLLALSEIINSIKNAQTAWNALKARIRLDTVNIDFDIDDVSLTQYKKLYKTMKDLGNHVEVLLDDIAEENQLLEMKLMPAVRKRGINSLPDEILQMILAEDIRSDEPRSLDLQLTCKRFNVVINSSADCWSRLSNRHNLSKKDISQLSTRKTSPIHIYISRYAKMKDSFKAFLLQNPDRIASIEWERDPCVTKIFGDHLEGSLNLPALKSLKITDFSKFPKWNYPNLTHLYSTFIPLPGSFPLLQHWSFRQGAELRSTLKYRITSEEGFGGDEILNFLDSTPRLKSLGLGLHTKDLVNVSRTSCVTLAGVESLTIDCLHLTGNSSKFMEKLKLPQVQRVNFTDEVFDGLRVLFGQSMSFQTVKSLEYRHNYGLRAWKDYDYSLLRSYDGIHRIFPNLERLDIRTEGYLFWYNSNATYWPNLRTVSLWHDDKFWKVNVAGLMANKNFASRLKHLRIYGPRLEDAVGKHRVDVSIRKILESVYDKDVLEVQPGIMAEEADSESLLRFRSEVGANCIARQ